MSDLRYLLKSFEDEYPDWRVETAEEEYRGTLAVKAVVKNPQGKTVVTVRHNFNGNVEDARDQAIRKALFRFREQET